MMMYQSSKENPAGISHDKTEHATNVASFVARNAFLGIVGMSAGAGILVFIILGLVFFGGIFLSIFAAF